MQADSGQERFKDAMAAVPSGVAVVSTAGPGGFRALAASSFTSASLEPPLVLVCLDSLTQTRETVAETAAFNLSVLERGQEFLAERFSGRAPVVDPSWREVPHRLGGNGLPIVEGRRIMATVYMYDNAPKEFASFPDSSESVEPARASAE